MRAELSNGVIVYQSPRLLERQVIHGFSTRLGGISPSPFDSMNLGNPAGADRQDIVQNIAENYHRLLAALGLPGASQAWVNQVHGCDVAILRAEPQGEYAETLKSEIADRFHGQQSADAIVSDQANVAVVIRIADCVPILLAAADGRMVAAIHAGWRGVVAGVIERTIKTMEELGESPKGLVGAIGPAISKDFFHVGAEVADAFVQAKLGQAVICDQGAQYRVDLNLAVRSQLERSGVSQIDFGDHCTYRDSKEFFSHRRDHGVTGRMAAIISARA